jgi:predicted MFS family arabinose efflux permease
MTLAPAAPRHTSTGPWSLSLACSVMGTGRLLSAMAPTCRGVLAARVLVALGAAAAGPVASGLGPGPVPPERQSHGPAAVHATR